MPALPLQNAMIVAALRTARLIPRAHLAEELALSITKWPNYRFLSPLEATRLFHRAYVAGYRQHFGRHFDIEAAPYLRIGARLDFRRPNRHLTQLWRARQHADHLGMPYPAYMEFAFDFAARRQRQQPPQPNQLAPSMKAHDAWHALLSTFWSPERYRLWLSKEAPLAQFHCARDIGLAVQMQFRAELLAVGTPPLHYRADFLVKRAVVLEQLDVDVCLALLPGENAHREFAGALKAKAEGRIAVHAYPAISAIDLQPACYGLPGIDTETGEPCRDCPLRQKCDTSRDQVTARLVDLTGSADPLAEDARAKNRERVAKSRARKKAAMMPAGNPAPHPHGIPPLKAYRDPEASPDRSM